MIAPSIPAAPLGAGAVPTDAGPRDGTGGVADLPSDAKVDVMMERYAPGGLPTQPAEVAVPEEGIGPGSELRIAYPDGSGGGCTANFVWEDPDGALYLGTAGHCVLPGGATATHGPGADYNTSGIEVSAAAEGCRVKPSTFVAEVVTCTTKEGPVWIELGEVAYARQTHPEHGAVGHDFALVEIPAELEPMVRTAMPKWGGPDGTATMVQDDDVLQYGHGLGWAALPETRRRAAKAVGRYPLGDGWMALGGSNAGDSGGPVVLGDRTGDADLFRGREAAGILTHGVGVGVASPIGAFLGTDVDHARWEARCFAGLSVRVVPNGSFPGDPGADCPDGCPEDCGGSGDDGNATDPGDGPDDLPTVYLEGAGTLEVEARRDEVRRAKLVANTSFSIRNASRPGWAGSAVLVSPTGSQVLSPDRCSDLPEDTSTFFGPPDHAGRLRAGSHPAGEYTLVFGAADDVAVRLGLAGEGPTRTVEGAPTNGSVDFVQPDEIVEQTGAPSSASYVWNGTTTNASVVMGMFRSLPTLDAGQHEMRQTLAGDRLCAEDVDVDLSVATPAGWVNAAGTWLDGIVPGGTSMTWSGTYEQQAGVYLEPELLFPEFEARAVVMEVA